jgi:hypothetical protein
MFCLESEALSLQQHAKSTEVMPLQFSDTATTTTVVS